MTGAKVFLDDVIKKLIRRYKLEGKLKVKRFVRTYSEIRKALHETSYIPDLDKMSLEGKKTLLTDIYDMDLSGKDDRFIEIQFRKIMRREIRDIENDIGRIS